jgi:hypothetical protein
MSLTAAKALRDRPNRAAAMVVLIMVVSPINSDSVIE